MTTYTVFDGEIVGENRNGSLTDYVPDPLGSTVALLDASQNQTDTFEYWPYGEVRSRQGSTQTPFQFVGGYGYYADNAETTYVRARHYQQNHGAWMTVDPVWPNSLAYQYCGANPVLYTDPSGMIFPLLVAGAAVAAGLLLGGCGSKCKPLDSKDKRALNECMEWFGLCGFTFPQYPLSKCSFDDPDFAAEARQTPGKRDCEIVLSLDFSSRHRDQRCKDLLHELLHCMCNVFQSNLGKGYENVHNVLDQWAIYLWEQCLFDYGGKEKPPPPPGKIRPPHEKIRGMPNDICSKIRGRTIPPRIRL